MLNYIVILYHNISISVHYKNLVLLRLRYFSASEFEDICGIKMSEGPSVTIGYLLLLYVRRLLKIEVAAKARLQFNPNQIGVKY